MNSRRVVFLVFVIATAISCFTLGVMHTRRGDAVVRVQLVASLGRRADRSLLASVSAESAAPVTENRLQAVISAYRSAVGEALGELVAQLP